MKMSICVFIGINVNVNVTGLIDLYAIAFGQRHSFGLSNYVSILLEFGTHCRHYAPTLFERQ